MNKKKDIQELKAEKLIDLSAFAENWTAPYVERSKLSEFSGGALNARTMANLDSKGQGIKKRINMGRKVLYPVKEVIAWMEARASLPKKGKVGQGGARA
ncbi:MAG: hypothetical protein D3921_11050 [Candidatus Electrothrix sp. AW1]|nr:hypothetical protein [Candidatus Electrothrix gigas]